MSITASMVKELRDLTGAGMMDCKEALNETNGDIEAAKDWLRKKGIAKAEKKSGRVAAEGQVYAWAEGNRGVLVEVNSETDFVARNDAFVAFTQDLAKLVLSNGETDVEKLKDAKLASGATVAETITALVATIGENISLRRATTLTVQSGVVSSYVHGGGKIGVLVGIQSSDSSDKLAETARNIAMHVAAANPQFLDRTSVDSKALDREREIFADQARQSGKPENIIEKIVDGRVNKFYEEVCLTEQAFIMDTDHKVADVVKSVDANAKISGFARFQLGEGIEKKEDDFAAEVARMTS